MIKVGIIGARGYSGIELVSYLLSHPKVQISGLFAQNLTSPEPLSKYCVKPEAASHMIMPLTPAGLPTVIKQSGIEVCFLATPAEASMELAPLLLGLGVKVIDLSGAFRLEAAQYPRVYGFTHDHPELCPGNGTPNRAAQYGLVPFIGPKGATLVANPGCYATAALLALVPLLKSDLIDRDSIVIDAKSGTSGAGKKASESLLFSECTEDCSPYRVGKHQHAPEIAFALSQLGLSIPEDFAFTTHLLPIKRGILCSIYAKLSKPMDTAGLVSIFKGVYKDYPLCQVGDIDDPQFAFSIKKAAHTPNTLIGCKVVGRKIFVFSSIDNLLKGAATQAIENFNRVMDIPLGLGLWRQS